MLALGNGGVHVNTAESFNAALKRAHMGVCRYASPMHLLRHISEAVFRWNGRKRTTLVLAGGGAERRDRRLPYRSLVAV